VKTFVFPVILEALLVLVMQPHDTFICTVTSRELETFIWANYLRTVETVFEDCRRRGALSFMTFYVVAGRCSERPRND